MQVLSQFLNQLKVAHWIEALGVVRCIKGSSSYSIHLTNHYSCQHFVMLTRELAQKQRRSIIGFCIFMEDALASWKSKKQIIVSQSSAEVEYRSMASTACELIWFQTLL